MKERTMCKKSNKIKKWWKWGKSIFIRRNKDTFNWEGDYGKWFILGENHRN